MVTATVDALGVSRRAGVDKVAAADLNAIVQALKDLDAGALHRTLAETVTGVHQFTVLPRSAAVPTLADELVNRAFVMSQVGPAASMPAIDASAAPYNMSPSATAAFNGAALQQAITDANGREVTAKAGEYPLIGTVLTDNHVNLYMPGVWFLIPSGSGTGIKIERTPATPMAVGATYLTWWGPWNPSGVTKSALLQAIPVPAGGFARFAGGRAYRIDSADRYPWAWSAQNLTNADGSSNYAAKTDGLATQAEYFSLIGVGMVVDAITNNGPMEQMVVQGSQSGAQGMVASCLTGNTGGGITATQAHITFTRVTGDFTPGETLIRVSGGNPNGGNTSPAPAAVGAPVGTVLGAPILLTADLFPLQYGVVTAANITSGLAGGYGPGTRYPVRTDNTVQLRDVDMDTMCRLEQVGFDVVGVDTATDEYVTAANRADGLELRGVYGAQVNYRVRNAWTRAVQAWSVYMGTFDGHIDRMANHAYLDQSAFAYGFELKSGSKANRITLQGHSIRHLLTTNPNERTFSMANNNASGKWSQWDYGSPISNTVHDFVVSCAYAASADTHPGDYYTTFENGTIYGGGSGGRYNTDNNQGAATRGFGTRFINVKIRNLTTGFGMGGVEHDAGFNHRIILRQCEVDEATAQGIMAPDAIVAGQCTIVIQGGSYSHRLAYPRDAAGASEPTNTKYYQAGVQVGSGVNLILEQEPVFRRFGGSPVILKGSGTCTVRSAILDYTETPSSATGIRAEGTRTIKLLRVTVDGSPSSVIRNVSGNSTWIIGDIQGSSSTTTLVATTGISGSPTYQYLTKLAGGSGGTGGGTTTTAGTQVYVDNTAVTELRISSAPPIRMLAIAADIPGPAAGATIVNLSQFQTALPVGTYEVEAELDYTSTVASAGALRFGVGGPGAAGASITNMRITQNTASNAATTQYQQVLGVSGDTAVNGAAGVTNANCFGLSAGAANTQLPVIVKGRMLVLTDASVLGLMWQLTTGATTVPALKAGSYLKFIQVA